MIESTSEISPAAHLSFTGELRATQASMLDVDFSEQSDIGKVREQNEDAHGHVAPANPESRLCLWKLIFNALY